MPPPCAVACLLTRLWGTAGAAVSRKEITALMGDAFALQYWADSLPCDTEVGQACASRPRMSTNPGSDILVRAE